MIEVRSSCEFSTGRNFFPWHGRACAVCFRRINSQEWDDSVRNAKKGIGNGGFGATVVLNQLLLDVDP